MPQIMEEYVVVIQLVWVQIVDFSATDHGGKRGGDSACLGADCGFQCHRSWRKRGSDSACTTGSRLWISVPQIMEEIVEVFSGSEEPQFMAVFSAFRRLKGFLGVFRAPPVVPE